MATVSQSDDSTHKLLRSILEAMPTGIVVVGRTGTIVMVNRRLAALFGYGRFELVGQPIEVLVPDRYRAQHVGQREAFLAAPQPRMLGVGRDLFGLRKDGSEIPVEIGLDVIETTAGVLALGVVTDITERSRNEEILRKSRELARSNAELDQFATIASHALQEPLRKMQSFGTLLAARAGEKLSQEESNFLKRMQAAAQHMQRLIKDLLAFARVTSQARLFEPVDLNVIVQKVLSDLKTRIETLGARIEFGDLPQLDSDANQMHQLFQNLINNALQFHRPGVLPVVAVQARVANNGDGLSLKRSRSDRICEITVRDNGIGFDEKHLQGIFLPFQRLYGRGEYEGTGMGLAICRKIVERHGGILTAQSTPGQGSTFVALLPLSQT